MGVVYDIQGVQTRAYDDDDGRIRQFLVESAAASERSYPGLVETFALNPDVKVPSGLATLRASGRLRYSDRIDAASVSIYHVGSPIELGVPISHIWPVAQHGGTRLVVTLHDLVPRLFPSISLPDALARKRYDARLLLVRRADRVLAVSASTAEDAVEHLGLQTQKVTVVGSGVSRCFERPTDPATTLATVHARLPAVERDFILYSGGADPRKNLTRLLEAYAALPENLREGHQLVILGRLRPAERGEVDRTLARLRIGDRVLFAGRVPDDLLAALYQSTALFVFPSLYEGFASPVAEAIACGAPVAVSRIGATRELVPEPAAQFEPHDSRSMAAAIARCLEVELNRRLRAKELPGWATWSAVADRTAGAYEEVAATGRRPRRRRRPRVAFVTSVDSYRLIEALAKYVDVDAVTPDEHGIPVGVRAVERRNFTVSDLLAGGWDQVFYCFDRAEAQIDLLRRRPGVVIAPQVGQAREAMAHSTAFVVHSRHAAQLARLEATPDDEQKIAVVPRRPEQAAKLLYERYIATQSPSPA